MIKPRWHKVSCQDLPELQGWRDQPFLKDTLLREANGEIDQFVENVAQRVASSLKAQGYSNDVSNPESQLPSLLKQGYSRLQIGRAFAQSWLMDDAMLYLPKRSVSDSLWITFGAPVIAALLSVWVLSALAVAWHEEFFAVLFFAQGILLIPALLLAWVYGLLWRKLLAYIAPPVLSDAKHPQHRLHIPTLNLSGNILHTLPAPIAPIHKDVVLPPVQTQPLVSLPMYHAIEAFDVTKHATLTLYAVNHYAFTQTLSSVPLGAEELPAMVSYYPIVFPLTGVVQPIAVFGLDQHNSFIDQNDQWRVPEIPKFVQHYPFTLRQIVNAPKGNMALAFDPDAPHFQSADEAGTALVTAEGQPSEFILQLQTRLLDWERHMQTTRVVLKELEHTEVLVTTEFKLQTSAGQVQKINGIRWVDIERVKALDDATLARWVRNGTMQTIYLHLASLRHLPEVLKS